MPETFPTNLWTRTDWQTARADKNKNGMVIPKGAARVSIGDDLDKFHAANAKGVREGIKAAQALKKDVTVYKAAVKTKYPKWYIRVEKQIEYNVDAYLSDTAMLPTYVKTYAARYNAANTAMMQLGADFIHWEKNGSNGKFKASNEKVALKALTDLNEAVKKMPYYTDKVTLPEAKTFDQTVYAATGGLWNKKTVEGLMKQVSELPATV
jgi:hypothetical protein